MHLYNVKGINEEVVSPNHDIFGEGSWEYLRRMYTKLDIASRQKVTAISNTVRTRCNIHTSSNMQLSMSYIAVQMVKFDYKILILKKLKRMKEAFVNQVG